jgi:molybdopterin converting factor small subunit
MNVTVKLFGAQAQLVGRREVVVPLDEADATCAALRRGLAVAEPQLEASLTVSRFAINHEFADDERAISANDEVALIGMISGG